MIAIIALTYNRQADYLWEGIFQITCSLLTEYLWQKALAESIPGRIAHKRELQQ